MTTIRAHVRNGQIVPDEPIDLPEGAEVTVALAPDAAQANHNTGRTLADVLAPFIGIGEGTPDASATYRDKIYKGKTR